MQVFHAISIRYWKRWAIIIIFALFTAVYLLVSQNGLFSLFSQDEPAAISRGDKDSEDIALTFNISWGEERVYDILDVLENKGVQATFFVSGEWAEKHPEILEEIDEGKHELGMLGYRYKSYLDQEIEAVRKDLRHAGNVFGKLGYEDMELLRTPSGHFNEEVIELAEDRGFQVVHWNVNPHDWKNPGKNKIVDRVMNETENGDIILMHASDSVKQTADALPTILKGLENKGFHFVPVSELIDQADAESKIIE